MSLGKRGYDILRGYIGREWDRINSVERDTAYEELHKDEVVVTRSSTTVTRTVESVPVDPKDHARELLGVSPEAPFNEIRKAFQRLNKRADPSNFPEGSDEATVAAKIQQKVQWAYTTLTEDMDTTEKRFRSLEIE